MPEAIEPLCASRLTTDNPTRSHRRTLVAPETSFRGDAHCLHDRGGHTRVGTIPRYVRDPAGPLIDTVVHYPELS
jgi:hypothetical protein